jgi:phosphatidate cytidylyltransferase
VAFDRRCGTFQNLGGEAFVGAERSPAPWTGGKQPLGQVDYRTIAPQERGICLKVRILTAMVLLCILTVVLVFLNTLLLNAVVGLISILAVYELLSATNLLRFRGLTVLTVIQALVLAFLRTHYLWHFIIPILLVIILGYFTLLIKNFGTMKVEHLAMSFLFSTLIPLFFSCAIHIRDDHGVVKGGFYLLVAMGAAWLSDTGAYFVGTFLGKHKLAPKVSPKKTVEGSVGGLIASTLLILLIGAGYTSLLASKGVTVQIHYLLLAFLTPIYSAIGMLGDLSASTIKREYGVKDYSNIMPGHGGILDRFDSLMFTLPAVYATVRHIDLFTFL